MNSALIFSMLLTLASAESTEVLDGKALFTARKCSVCHSVAALDIKATRPPGPIPIIDVSGLSTKYKADWLERYLKKNEKIRDELHPPRFKGTDAELDALVRWLMTIKPADKKTN